MSEVTDPRVETAARAIEDAMLRQGKSPDAHDLARAALLAADAAAWQPIETGPINETAVLLFIPDTHEIITGYSDGKRSATSNKLIWYETLSGYGYEWDTCLYDSPTHWMPLPMPPEPHL